jgi:hypothetical protein
MRTEETQYPEIGAQSPEKFPKQFTSRSPSEARRSQRPNPATPTSFLTQQFACGE